MNRESVKKRVLEILEEDKNTEITFNQFKIEVKRIVELIKRSRNKLSGNPKVRFDRFSYANWRFEAEIPFNSKFSKEYNNIFIAVEKKSDKFRIELGPLSLLSGVFYEEDDPIAALRSITQRQIDELLQDIKDTTDRPSFL